MRRSKLLAFLLAGAMLVAAGCSAPVGSSSSGAASTTVGSTEATSGGSSEPAKGIANEDIKVGFIYIGVPGDYGYTYAQDQGRKELEENLGVQTITVENVPETAADVESTIRNLVDQGCNVIFSTSFGYQDATYDMSQEFPEVYFFHCSGDTTSTNMSQYFGKIEQIRYLSGIVAGMKTKTNKIGYVAAMQIPEVIRGLDAFALGVKSVNPDATVEVVWTGTWYDPSLEKSAAVSLLNKGCDVLGQHQDTPSAQQAAEEAGAFAIGYNTSTADLAPGAYLTAPLWDWGVYMTEQVQDIIDGTYESGKYWGDMDTGIVYLDKLTDLAEPGTQEAVDTATAKIKGTGFTEIFKGPLKDNEGNVKVEEGKSMTDDEVWGMMWLVDNVIGTVSQ